MLRHCTVVLLSLLYCCLPQTVAALDMDVRTSSLDRLDFAMWISNNETTLNDRSITTRIKYRRIGITSFDIPAAGIQFGMQLGYVHTTQEDIAATQGFDLNGYYLGLGMRAPLLELNHLRASFVADYIYQDAKGSNDTEKVTRDWHEYDAGLLAVVPLERFDLLAGMFYQRFDATQTASGTIQQTLFLENNDTVQKRLGIDYLVAPGEHVGLHYHSGSSKGVQLKFQKLF